MAVLQVKIKKLRPNAILPQYQSKHSAGMDLHACLDEAMVIKPMDRVIVPTGLSVELPDGYEALIYARSGLAYRDGITMANGTGVIDADYRGEYGVLIVNLSNDDFVIEPNARIAQLVISQYERVSWVETDDLSITERGTGGFGSTGIK